MPRWNANPEQNTFRNALSRPGLCVILGLYLVVAFIYSITTPSFEASDELWHYPFVKRLADGQGLPVQTADQIGPWRQEGSQPPLYYAAGALLTAWVDTSDMDTVRWLNPHADIGIPKPDRNANMVIHTDAERLPYHGTLLALHIVRWFSLLLGAITVISAYLLARQIFADELLALTTSALTAFNAMFLFITASVNNDAMVISLSALALWLMVRYIAGRPSVAQWFGLGIVLGLACLTKASALALLPLSALVATVVACRHRSWDDFLYAGAALVVPVLAISGWWYWRNWRLYRDPLGLNAFVAIVGPRYPVPSLRQLMAEWKGFVMSYWGFFGGVNVPAPGWYYWAASLLGLLGLGLAPLYLWRHRKDALTGRRLWQLGLTILLPLVVFAALIRWTLLTIASQGRLMFPAISAISLWSAMGWTALFRNRMRLVLPLIAGAFMAVSATMVPFLVIIPAYAKPPLSNNLQDAVPQYSLDIRFNGKIRLAGYDLGITELTPGDPVTVTMYYQALEPMDDDYSVFVHLISQDGLIVGQRDRYPGQGTFPTSLWQPGDVFTDTFVVPSDNTILTPNQITLATGFYKLANGARLPVIDAAGQTVADSVSFGTIHVPARVVDGIPNPVMVNFGNKIALVGFSLDRSSIGPGDTLHLMLFWKALDDVNENYTVFTQVLARDDRKLAQVDSWPQGGQSPTATWRRGQVITDTYSLTIATEAQPEIVELHIGLYDSDVVRLPILGQGGHVQDTRLVLAKIKILNLQAVD